MTLQARLKRVSQAMRTNPPPPLPLGQNLLLMTIAVLIVSAFIAWEEGISLLDMAWRAFRTWVAFSMAVYMNHWGWCPSGWLNLPAQLTWGFVMMIPVHILLRIVQALFGY